MTDGVQLAAMAGTALSVLAGIVAVTTSPASHGTRSRAYWLWTGIVVTATFAMAGATLHLLVDWPSSATAGLAVGCVAIPAAFLVAGRPSLAPRAGRALVTAIVTGGMVALVVMAYLLTVVGLGQVPEGHERTTLALSMAAAAAVAILALPTRRRLEDWAHQRVHGERHLPDEALHTFGTRMTRAVPMDELMLQLVETLKKSLHLAAAEVWTGGDGQLVRSVSVPERGLGRLHLREEELGVVARARAQGNAWLQVWAPELLEGRSDHLVRSVSIAHLGELLGMIVVERNRDDTPFTEEEDRVLVELARQVGLALHNVRLDAALQASLEELQLRNEELVASRARIVAAGDESRRQIERNLHDGAQQHLVALAVKVGLINTLMDSDPETATAMLSELRSDVQTTLTELRDLAHGIYPPLLRDRGLREALQTAANRAALPATVTAADLGRYHSDVEAAVYFCCLEAIQNAGKYAGETASIEVSLGDDDGRLWFDVADCGAGFDPVVTAQGHGFVNMRDRLGAFGGTLTVTSSVGTGTTIRGTLPVSALAERERAHG